MNELKVNYIQTGKVLLVGLLLKFRKLFLDMPPKRVFREPKNAKEEKDYLAGCVPRATRYATKWAYKIFGAWQSSRRNKDANLVESGFKVEVDSIQNLETSIVEMSAESLDFWLTKFAGEVCKGERRAVSPKKFVQYLLWITALLGSPWKRAMDATLLNF